MLDFYDCLPSFRHLGNTKLPLFAIAWLTNFQKLLYSVSNQLSTKFCSRTHNSRYEQGTDPIPAPTCTSRLVQCSIAVRFLKHVPNGNNSPSTRCCKISICSSQNSTCKAKIAMLSFAHHSISFACQGNVQRREHGGRSWFRLFLVR